MAWTLLCQGHMDEYSLQNTPELLKQKTQEVEDLLEKVVYHTQAMLANTMHIGQEDYVWLIQSLIRVVGHSLSLVQVYHLSEGLATRLKSLWKVLRQITKHLLTSSTRHILLPALYQTYLCIQSHDQTREFTKEIFDFLKNQLFHAEYDELVEAVTQTSGAMLWSACQLLQSLVKQELLDANSTHSSALLSPPLAYAFLGQLIDACFVKLAGTSFIAQSHVEFSHDYLAVEPDYEHMAKCFQVIFTTWRQVQRHHLQHNADEKLTWYLMMYRSLALGLHLNIAHQSEGGSTAAQEGASSTSNTRDDDEDFFDGEGGSSPAVASSSSGAASSANPSKSSTAIVGGVLEDEHEYTIGSYGQFVTFFREQILRQVPSFKSASRLVMKSVSIFFASECMYYYQHQQDNTLYHETHADLGLARAFLVKVCDGKAKKGKEWMSLDCIPMILFLQDIVNMTCACASFTVQDKHILALQVSSMHLLADVIHVFHAAVDVDAVQPTGSNIVDYSYDKLLTQSLSQLLAAIRTGLSVDHCPRLHFATYSCLLSLIESGYLRDKVAFKRLLKPIISYSEDNHLLNTASNSATGLQPYSYSKVLPEEQSIMEKLFYFHLVACFSCIIANGNNASKELSVYGKHTESGIRSVLAATFQPFSSLTQDYSRYLLLDMIRILQWRAAQSASSSLDDGNAGKDNSEADGSSSATEGANDSKELHPNRGGFTYPTSTKFMNLWPAYVECFPTFAFLYLRSKQENAVKLVATCTQSLLVDMVQSNHKLSNKLTSNTWIELLSVIESLTQQQAEHVDILNVDYWQSLILNLATLGHTQVLPSSSTIHVYLLTILNHVVSSAQTQSQELKDAIQTKMWKVFVQLIRVILPGIFGEDKSSKLCSADDWLLLVGKSTASKEQANVLLLTLQVVSRLQTLSEGRSDANQYVLQWMTRLTMAILHHSVDKSSTVQALVTTMIQNALNTTSSPQKIVYVQFQEMNQVMFKAAQQYAQSNIVDVQMKIVASFDLSVMTWLQLYQGASNALPQVSSFLLFRCQFMMC